MNSAGGSEIFETAHSTGFNQAKEATSMFNRIVVPAALATAFVLTAASAQAYPPAPSPQHYRCSPDGKPANPGTGWCKRTDGSGPAPAVVPQPGNPPAMQQQQQSATVRPLSPSEVDNLKQVLRGEMQQQMVVPRASQAKPAPAATAAQQQQQEVKIVIEMPKGTNITMDKPAPAEPPKTSDAPKASVDPIASATGGKVFRF